MLPAIVEHGRAISLFGGEPTFAANDSRITP